MAVNSEPSVGDALAVMTGPKKVVGIFCGVVVLLSGFLGIVCILVGVGVYLSSPPASEPFPRWYFFVAGGTGLLVMLIFRSLQNRLTAPYKDAAKKHLEAVARTRPPAETAALNETKAPKIPSYPMSCAAKGQRFGQVLMIPVALGFVFSPLNTNKGSLLSWQNDILIIGIAGAVNLLGLAIGYAIGVVTDPSK
jgi:hypothetical protein